MWQCDLHQEHYDVNLKTHLHLVAHETTLYVRTNLNGDLLICIHSFQNSSEILILTPEYSGSQHHTFADVSVDLCSSRPLGTPLADITSGCLHYSTCEKLADGQLVETRYGCKKGLLFSQLRKRCVLAKKVGGGWWAVCLEGSVCVCGGECG